jgi:hypothetical protein
VLTHEVKPADLTNTGVASTAQVGPRGRSRALEILRTNAKRNIMTASQALRLRVRTKKTGSKWTPVQGPGCLPKPSNKTTLGQSGRSMCPQLELEVGGSLCR